MEGSSSKRQKSNLGSALKKPPAPSFEKGIEYWDGIDATVNGVLGGFGDGPVPHIDQLSSRLFLLSLLPSLQTFPSPLTPIPPPRPGHRLTVLDVGAGIGRVSKEVLTPLFDDVVLMEPVEKMVREAYRSASDGEWRDLPRPLSSSSNQAGEADKEGQEELKRRMEKYAEGRGKRVWFIRAGLQGFDPSLPLAQDTAESLGVVGSPLTGEGSGGLGEEVAEVIYDAIWCQWCLGHMSTPDLITFLKKARAALRPPSADPHPNINAVGGYESLIFVKENCCEDEPDGKGREFLDEEDSSLTRSEGKWLEIFKEAGLGVVKEEVQEGMPAELFMVKTWALR